VTVVDLGLVRLLEASATDLLVATVAAMRARDASSPALAVRLRSGAMVAMGPGRYVNRAVGTTLDVWGPGEVEAVDDFFTALGLTPEVELSAWAPPETVTALGGRRYVPRSFRSVLARSCATEEAAVEAAVEGASIEEVDGSTSQGWLDVMAVANDMDHADRRWVSDEMTLANAAVAGSAHLVAVADGRVVAAGSVHVVDGIAWLGGAATLPDWRGRGLQAALIRHRLRLGREAGAELAAATAVPAGGSARNLVRLGFEHVQTQAIVTRSG